MIKKSFFVCFKYEIKYRNISIYFLKFIIFIEVLKRGNLI